MTLMSEIKKLKRNAFTLVELLIVIVVIAILAAAIMFASDEIVSSAQAARILANLENWKQAAYSWYTDNISIVQPNGKVKDRKSGYIGVFCEEDRGAGKSVVKAKDLLPYLNMSGLTVNKDGAVLDGYGGQFKTDFSTINEKGKKGYNENYKEANHDEYQWMIVYQLPGMSQKLKDKLERKYVAQEKVLREHVDKSKLHWKAPGYSLQYEWKESKKENSIGIIALDFRIENEYEY